MKIVEENSGLLTNSEAAAVLLDRGAHKPTSNALPCERKVYEYLVSNTPGVVPRENLRAFAEAAAAHGLTKGEVLHLANVAPSLPVELHLVVTQNIDERFPDEEHGGRRGAVFGEILDLVRKHLRGNKA